MIKARLNKSNQTFSRIYLPAWVPYVLSTLTLHVQWITLMIAPGTSGALSGMPLSRAQIRGHHANFNCPAFKNWYGAIDSPACKELQPIIRTVHNTLLDRQIAFAWSAPIPLAQFPLSMFLITL